MNPNWPAVVARRMQRQGLSAPLPTIGAAVSAMGGAHAQVLSAAELSIGVRVDGITAADVRSAMHPGGELVKTYGVRGTVHLLPRDELSLWCSALSTLPVMGSLPPAATMDAAQFADVLAAIAAALADGSSLDADELGAAVVASVGDWAAEPVVPAFGGWWPRWRPAISRAAYLGILAFGENRGTRVTYASPSVVTEPDHERALEWLLRRYLHSYGPVTAENYGRWLGARKAWATAQFARFDELRERVEVEGSSAFVLGDDTVFTQQPVDGISLLPHFDPNHCGAAATAGPPPTGRIG